MPARRNALDAARRICPGCHLATLATANPHYHSCPDSLFNTMARILITGGAGYVGSHCAKALAAMGHEGVVLDTTSGRRNDIAKAYPQAITENNERC